MPRKRQAPVQGGQPNGYTPPGPDYATGAPPTTAAPAPGPMPLPAPTSPEAPAAGGPVAGGNPLEAAVGALQGQAYSPLLAGPSQRPDIPVTAGLPSGPGAGPEALGRMQTGRITSLLQRMADTSKNPKLASLAEEAAQQKI